MKKGNYLHHLLGFFCLSILGGTLGIDGGSTAVLVGDKSFGGCDCDLLLLLVLLVE